MQQFDRILSRAEEWLCMVLLAEAAILTVLQVVLRYAFGLTYSWMVELINYSFIYSALVGASIGVRGKVHLGVDILVNKLPPRLGRFVAVVALLLTVLFTVSIALVGTEYVMDIRASGQVSPDLEIPKWIPYTAVPVGFLLMSIRFAQELYGVVTGKVAVGGSHGHADRDIPVLLAEGEGK